MTGAVAADAGTFADAPQDPRLWCPNEGVRELGAWLLPGGRCRFLVWAPEHAVEIELLARDGDTARSRRLSMRALAQGYHAGVADGVAHGDRYLVWLGDAGPRDQDTEAHHGLPDPASRWQPEGVHGASAVFGDAFPWSDGAWRGVPLDELVFYELHVGTFTAEGTFDAVVPRLDELVDLGVTAIEIMPVAQFPGGRNWGYDGVQPFAAQSTYGGPLGLKRLVDACHARGIAVFLDVVYNHFGPEGNWLPRFGPYLTDHHRTPWGPAVNLDGAGSSEVRRFFVENALQWLEEFHCDGMRLDAVHALFDASATPFLAELQLAVEAAARRQRRPLHLIAESDLNDPRLVRRRELGGHGLAAAWSDDLHHAVHVLLTGERDGYYADFGELRHLQLALERGFTYAGEYSAHRQRRHGTAPSGLAGRHFVVCAQNHDQIGNRMRGERLAHLVSFEATKLAAGTTLLAPFLPLLFMGEEHADEAPFPFFVSHGDADLVAAVRAGRAREFAAFAAAGAEPPDPQAEATFAAAKLRGPRQERQHCLRTFHEELLRLRRDHPTLHDLAQENRTVVGYEDSRMLMMRRGAEGVQVIQVGNWSARPSRERLPFPRGRFRLLLDSADPVWLGPGGTAPGEIESDGAVELALPAHSFAVYAQVARPATTNSTATATTTTSASPPPGLQGRHGDGGS